MTPLCGLVGAGVVTLSCVGLLLFWRLSPFVSQHLMCEQRMPVGAVIFYVHDIVAIAHLPDRLLRLHRGPEFAEIREGVRREFPAEELRRMTRAVCVSWGFMVLMFCAFALRCPGTPFGLEYKGRSQRTEASADARCPLGGSGDRTLCAWLGAL